VEANVPAANVTECMTADAANGQPLAFTVNGGVMVNDATVTLPDVVTSNGVIHVIDKVLTPSDSPNDIPRTAQCTGIHNSLVSAVVQAELLETLQGAGPFTLFAPTDQAFTDAGIDLASLDTPEGKAVLQDILLYHVVAGNVPSSAVTECMSAPAVNGQPLAFTVDGGVMVNDATVTMPDVSTSNGIIHVIDKVLMPTDTPNDIPRTASCTGNHSSLVSAVVQAGLLETLQGDGPFTVFAPTDQAFADAGIDLAALDTPEGKATLSDILLYHVVGANVPAANVTDCMSATTVNGNPLSFTVGETVMVNGATVTATDVPTSNGIIHVIDTVLMPTSTPNDIPRTAQCTGAHDSLVAAVVQAELLTTLQGDGPFTVFAPTDQAFADAGIDLAALDTPEGKATLADILLYHVVAGAVPSSAVTECMSADAANGQPLAFTVDGTVMVNDATVTTADVNTSNGIIHVIDKVLTPTDAHNDIARTAGCTGVHTSLVAALIQAELVATLQGEGPFTVFAPTDEAFAAAGIDLAALDTEEGKATLTDILLYHVHAGSVMAANLSNGLSVEMVNGDNTTVGDGAVLNGANITLADVKASNGVIHVIDMVLMPPADEVEDTTDTDNEALSDGDDGNVGTVLIAVGALVAVAAVGVVLFLRQRNSPVNLTSGGIIDNMQPMGSMMATTEVAQTSSYTATAAAATAQPVAQATTQQSTNPDVGVVQQWTDMNGYTWRTMQDGSTLWWTGSSWEKYA
ncbi:MAG: fasciclin domain-containing protein, partial [Candidatus Poseidoniaceae archaeon]